MRFVSGATPEEKRIVCGWQRTVDAVEDNSVGMQTVVDTLCKLDADVFPVNVTMFNQPVIVAKDALPAAVNAPLKKFAYAISGSFSWERKPCSILVRYGERIRDAACHAHLGYPESVLYRTDDGTFGVARVRSAAELPGNTAWAVGGCGLLDNYNPAAEGFIGRYADVLHRTNHTYIGTKGKFVYLGYCKNMTAIEVNNYVKKLKLDYAVLLDGGHIAAINGPDDKINTSVTTQSYIVQGV